MSPSNSKRRLNKCPMNITFTVQSLEAVTTRFPSFVKTASFTYDVWPRNSFNIFPDLMPWILHDTGCQEFKRKFIKSLTNKQIKPFNVSTRFESSFNNILCTKSTTHCLPLKSAAGEQLTSCYLTLIYTHWLPGCAIKWCAKNLCTISGKAETCETLRMNPLKAFQALTCSNTPNLKLQEIKNKEKLVAVHGKFLSQTSYSVALFGMFKG